ncbi:MAG: carbohydrate kinase family protein [bacterium]|nr:carbohydrate kinase family protein [bacterium]
MEQSTACAGSVLACSHGFIRCPVIVAASVNEEMACPDGQVIEGEEEFVWGEKNIVLGMNSFSLKPGEEVFEITAFSGRKIKFCGINVQRIPAGSSLNTAFVLKELDVDSVAVLAPIGTGRTGESLALAMQAKGFETLLCHREGTARTLNIRHANGDSTLFLEKPPYTVGQDTRAILQQARPRIVIGTGVKSMDMPLIQELFNRQGVIKVFNPSSELIVDAELRERWQALVAEADLLQVNLVEASKILGRKFDKAGDIFEISKLGANITIVTMREKGAILLEKGSKEPIVQPGFPVSSKDSSGAGDAHLAAFVYYRYLNERHAPVAVCFTMAGWLASGKAASFGPWSGIAKKEKRRAKLFEFWPEGNKEAK